MTYSPNKIFICVFVSLLIVTISVKTETMATAGPISFCGWKDCYRISNGTAELIVVPAIGRAVSFKMLDGPNVFYFVDKNKGRTRKSTNGYINFGGLYTWLAPQFHWRSSAEQKKVGTGGMALAPFDGVAHKVKNAGPNSITITNKDTDVYGMTMDKTYALAEDSAKLIYTVKITNVSNVLLRWAVWNLTAVNPTGRVVFEAPDGWSDLHFLRSENESSVATYKPHFQFAEGLAVLNLTAMDAMGKKLFVKPNGSYILQHVPDQYWLVRTFPKLGKHDRFTDDNSQIEIWVDKRKNGVIEIETLSCDIAIEPGESYSWQETFEIKSTKNFPWLKKNLSLKHLVSSVLKNNSAF